MSQVRTNRNSLFSAPKSAVRYPPDLQFGFNTHVRDGCQLLRKFSALPCFECGRQPRNRQLVPQVPLIGTRSEPFIEDRNNIEIG